MSKQNTALMTWEPNLPIAISPDASANEIAAEAKGLTARDIHSISTAFQAGSYEMVSTFVWTRAVVMLKKQIGSLGMEFVGQMLGRADIDEDSDPATSLSENDAISLAEDLGMITTTEALRLKHSLELVAHFSDPDFAAQDQMSSSEAESILRSCVASVLGSASIKPPIQFSEFREALENEPLSKDDLRVTQIGESPYFVQRTTLSVLLALVKSSDGAQLEHAIGNTNVILPKIWKNLRKPEKWQVGQAFAEVHNAGNQPAAIGLKHALSKVRGFDFVPESLRSETFARVAHKLMETHFAFQNFYNEPAPMKELLSLGTTIPRPAFPVCMTAVLCVRLGNSYGVCSAAQRNAGKLLSSLRKEQWEYYLNECLAHDKTIVDKLGNDAPANRWIDLVDEYELTEMDIADKKIRNLVSAEKSTNVHIFARKFRPKDK